MLKMTHLSKVYRTEVVETYAVRDGIATKTPVTLGPSSIDKVEILQGLKAGDKIVISGTSNFNGAAKVAISN